MLKIAVGLALIVLLLNGTSGQVAHAQAGVADRVEKPPLTLRKQIIHKDSSLPQPLVHEETFSRRSDGSYVRTFETESPTGEKGIVTEILDRRNGIEVTLDSLLKLKTTFKGTERKMLQWLESQPSCTDEEVRDAGLSQPGVVTDRILGFEVIQVRTFDGGRKSMVKEAWVAPALDCYPLRGTMTFLSGAEQEQIVTQLHAGEPPDSVFEIPPDYVEASPLQVEAAYQAKYPYYPYWGDKMGQVVEERYQKNRRTHAR